MNAGAWARIAELFEAAVELDAPSRRALYARECPDDPGLTAHVERLVGCDSRAGGFLAPPPLARRPRPLESGARLGAYTLVRRIGAGGMGVVYEALQERPRRRVALKVVQSAHSDAATLRRFHYEAEALGRLRHPGIAQVHEAGIGVDADGVERAFLAMEFVEGARSITAYARDSALELEAVARLFIGVCTAVHHGHERGVLHRDLKPSNVLVDAGGATKVIDFGIAKVVGQDRTDATAAGEIVGTLATISPEQLGGDPSQVDVRSDVYALGAILYELLCGAPHVDLRGLALPAALDRVRRSEPARPTALRPDLPLELEWIALRALDADRERRYGSAADLARDLERYLADEPVEAGPPSTAYRLAKFVRRNRLAVGAGVAVLVAVVGGAAIALVQRDRAIEAFGTAQAAGSLATERLARLEVEARTNRELADFQARIFASSDPDAGGRELRVVEALADASSDLDAREIADPRLQLRLRRSIAEAFVALGLGTEALRELEAMRPVWESTYAPADRERLELERIHLTAADGTTPIEQQHALAIAGLARARDAFGDDDVETAGWRTVAGTTANRSGRYEEGAELLRLAIEALSRAKGAGSSEAIEARLQASEAMHNLRRNDEAERLAREAVEAAAALGVEHKTTLRAKAHLASALKEQGRFDDAIALYDEVLAAHERRTGATSLPALVARLARAETLRQARRPTEALAELDRVLADSASQFGQREGFAHRAHFRRAWVLVELDRVPEAVEAFERAHAAASASLGPDDVVTLDILSTYAFSLFRLGRFDDALPRAREAWLRSVRVIGASSPVTLMRANGCAVLLANVGRKSEAVEVLEWLLAVQDESLGPRHSDSILTLKNRAMIRRDAGDLEGARCDAEELVRRADADLGGDLLESAGAHWALGMVSLDEGDAPTAASHLAIAGDRWSRSSAAGTEIAIHGLIDEAKALAALGSATLEQDALERAVALACGKGLSPTMRPRALTALAEFQLRSGDLPEARSTAEMALAGATELEPEIRQRLERVLRPD